MRIPIEVLDLIVDYIYDPISFRNMYFVNREMYYYCKSVEMKVCKKLLDYYQVEYHDSTNFIYIQNNVRQNWFRNDPFYSTSEYNYVELMNLYMRFYHHTVIDCEYHPYNGYFYNPSDGRIHIDDEKINVNRMSCRNPTTYWDYKPSDADYPLQLIIRNLRKKWDDDRYNYYLHEFANTRLKLHDAYKALLHLKYNYTPSYSIQLPWYNTYRDMFNIPETTNENTSERRRPNIRILSDRAEYERVRNEEREEREREEREREEREREEREREERAEWDREEWEREEQEDSDDNTIVEDDLALIYGNSRHDIVDMCYITSIPMYPNVLELNCQGQHIGKFPNFPKLRSLFCSYNYYLTELPAFPKLKRIHALFTRLNIQRETFFPKINNLRYSPYEQGYTNVYYYYKNICKYDEEE